MKLLSTAQLQTIATEYINDAKIANPSWTPSVNDYTGLVKKIFTSIMVDGSYSEKLEFMDGFRMTTGETIEEYFLGFVAPTDLDPDGANTMSPAYIDVLPSTYSSRLGEKTLKVTERYSLLQNSFQSEEAFRNFVSMTLSHLYASLEMYLNTIKRQELGKIADIASLTNQVSELDPQEDFVRGERAKDSNDNGIVFIKAYTGGTLSQSTAEAFINAGYAVALDTATSIAIPTDTASGEAFIKSVKNYAEAFQFPSQGYSLNGNIAPVAPKYLLLVKKGIFPSLEVDTYAGAFHLDKLGFGVETRQVKDFGDNENVFAMLIDERAIKLHNNTRYTLEQINADGGFINYVIHDEETAYYSPNTMIHVWNAE